MFRLIDFAKLLLVAIAMARLSTACAESFNLYPFPIETLNGVAVVTTSYGDTGEKLPVHFIGRDAQLSTLSLKIDTMAPHAEVFWSPERADFVIVYGRNQRVSSERGLGSMSCRMFSVQTGPVPQSRMEELDDGRCNSVLKEGFAGLEKRASLDWLGSARGKARLSEGVILRGEGGNRLTMEAVAGRIGDVFVYLDGAIVLLDTGHFVATGSSYERLSVNLKGTSVSIAQFYDVFHRPDVVRAKLSGDDITAMTGEMSIAKALQNPPPSVELSPVATVVKSSRIPVRVSVDSNGGGIAEIRVFLNGKLIASDGYYKGSAQSSKRGVNAGSDVPSPAETSAARTNSAAARGANEKACSACKMDILVDVIPGVENIVTAVAFNRDNTIQSLPASRSFRSTLPAELPRLWVLSVGINEYMTFDGHRMVSLVNARKDAEDFVCAYAAIGLSAAQGLSCPIAGRAASVFRPQDIRLAEVLLDDGATRSRILKALDLVAQQSRPGDTFVWFVASHGLLDEDGIFGIVAHDTQCVDSRCSKAQNLVSSNDILDASKKIKAMNQLIVLDTCHSGGLDSKLSGLYDSRVSLLARNMGLHLYASAQATEAALDGEPGTNGAFTAQLLNGISGAAPRNDKNQISVVSLGDWVKTKTIEVTTPDSTGRGAVSVRRLSRPVQTPVIQHYGQDFGLAR